MGTYCLNLCCCLVQSYKHWRSHEWWELFHKRDTVWNVFDSLSYDGTNRAMVGRVSDHHNSANLRYLLNYFILVLYLLYLHFFCLNEYQAVDGQELIQRDHDMGPLHSIDFSHFNWNFEVDFFQPFTHKPLLSYSPTQISKAEPHFWSVTLCNQS